MKESITQIHFELWLQVLWFFDVKQRSDEFCFNNFFIYELPDKFKKYDDKAKNTTEVREHVQDVLCFEIMINSQIAHVEMISK